MQCNERGTTCTLSCPRPRLQHRHIPRLSHDLFRRFESEGIDQATLIMDNVPFHKTATIRGHVENNGHRIVFLPPYSPFLNPIENVFSKWKEEVRRGAPENEQQLLQLIHNASSSITQNDCAAYCRHVFNFIPQCMRSESIIDE